MLTHDYRLFFIHVPKCAGRSICDTFNQRFDQYTAQHYRTEYAFFWKQYDHFTIIRNPYDRYVSMYHYIKEHRRHSKEPVFGNLPFKEWLMNNVYHFRGEFLLSSPEGQRGTDYMLGSPHWFSPQCRTLENNDGDINDITVCRYENGLNDLKQYLRSKNAPDTIPHLNATKHEHYLRYYDYELLHLLTTFYPLVRDCTALGYDILT